jgi:hypothetical protein
MIREKQTEVRALTVDLAHHFRDMKAVPGERGLKRNRIDFLLQRFYAGLFHSPIWADAILVETGERYRINGMHSSTMLCNLDPFPTGLYAVIHHFTCDSTRDLAELHAQFDAAQSSRSTTELVGIALRSQPELSEVSKTYGRIIAQGISFKLNGLKSKGEHSRGGIEKLPLDYPEFTIWANQFMGKSWLRRGAVVAMMFECYNERDQKCRDCATQFWRWVREEDHPDVKHPTRVLASFLRDSSLKGANSHRQQWSLDAIYRKCILAWNAFCDNRTTDLKYYAKTEMPHFSYPRRDVMEAVEADQDTAALAIS